MTPRNESHVHTFLLLVYPRYNPYTRQRRQGIRNVLSAASGNVVIYFIRIFGLRRSGL